MLWFEVPGTPGIHIHFLLAAPATVPEKGELIAFRGCNNWSPILSGKAVTVLQTFALNCQQSQWAEGGVSRQQPQRSEKEMVCL